jgi:intraflagellar transport protein 46
VGTIEDFLKPERPDTNKETLGLTVIDEPCLDQTDPYILDLKYRQNKKEKTKIPIAIRTIDEPFKNPKYISKYVTKVEE